MTLRNKILLLSVGPVTIVMIAVVGLALDRLHSQLLRQAQNRIRSELVTAAKVVEQGNRTAVSAAIAMATVEKDGLFGRRPESLRLAREVLEKSPRFIGTYLAYEQNADGQDRVWLSRVGPAHGSCDAGGRFLPYWFRSPRGGGRITLEPLTDPDTSLYYGAMKEKYLSGSPERFIITEPFLYNNQNLVIKQSSPIVIGGKFAGVAGVDRGLDFLHEFLVTLKPYRTSELMLLSGRGRIIATTFTEKIGADLSTVSIDDLYLRKDGTFPKDLYRMVDGKKVLDLGKATKQRTARLRTDFKDMVNEIVRGVQSDRVRESVDPLDGQRVYGVAARVPTGGWTLLMMVGKDEIIEPVRKTVLWTAGVALAGLLLVVALLIWVANGIAGRIQHLGKLARRVAEGDLRVHTEVESSDETGRLQRAIQSMIESLGALLGKVKESGFRLAAVADEIAAGSRRQERAMKSFDTSAGQIAAAGAEIAGTSQELLETMKELREVTSEVTSLADSGHTALNGTVQAMDRLTAAASEVSAELVAVNEQADTINVVVHTITKVAEQTNMLSLNASIEAEKAGEYGSGFEAVAREIRRLADQTAAATLDITRMVGEVQSALAGGATEMNRFAAQVRGAAGGVHEASKQLSEIMMRVQVLPARFTGVASGMETEAEGARQISASLTALSGGVRLTTETLEEFHRATRDLQEAVYSLRAELSRFRMREETAPGKEVS